MKCECDDGEDLNGKEIKLERMWNSLAQELPMWQCRELLSTCGCDGP